MFALIIRSSLIKIAGWQTYIVTLVISQILPAGSFEAFSETAFTTL